jgi:hypothetical protein
MSVAVLQLFEGCGCWYAVHMHVALIPLANMDEAGGNLGLNGGLNGGPCTSLRRLALSRASNSFLKILISSSTVLWVIYQLKWVRC